MNSKRKSKLSLFKIATLFIFLSSFLSLSVQPVFADCELVNSTFRTFDFTNNQILYDYSCPTGTISCDATLSPTTICCTSSADCSLLGRANDPTCGNIGTVRTALGCINASDPQALISLIAGWTLGIAAFGAFAGIAYSGFIITTSSGDIKKVNEAKSWLMSSLLGLLLVSVALVLLNFIGVNLLNMGSLGFSLTP